MVGTATLGGEDTLLIGLVNDAMLLDEAACCADQSPLGLFHNQLVDFTAIHALVFLDILLRLRQFVLFCLILSFDLALPLLFVYLLVLLIEESVDHHVILTSLQVLRVVNHSLLRSHL